MVDGALRSAFPLRQEWEAFAHAARWASIDRDHQRASGRCVLSEFQYPPTCRIPAACWRAYACRVVSRANIKPPDVGRCCAMQPSRKSRSNSMSLRANYRGAGAHSQSDRIQPIATNGRFIPHPQPALPRVRQAARTHNPFLKRGSFRLSQIADEEMYRTVGQRTSRHESTNVPAYPASSSKSRGTKRLRKGIEDYGV